MRTWFIGGTNTIQVGRDFSVKERSVQIQTDEGGKAQIKIYMLYDSAAWSYGSSSKLITHTNRSANLADFLDSPEFSRDVQSFDTLVCLGLASGVAKGNLADTIALSDARAVTLCGLVSRKIEAMLKKTKVFGLPLGYHKNSKVKPNSLNERRQRSVVILGVQSLSGTLETETEQQRVISLILENDIVDEFRFSDYSEVSSGKSLRYLCIERGQFPCTQDGQREAP